MKLVATLSSAGSAASFGPTSISGSTLVAANSAIDVFTRPAGGWVDSGPRAVLSDQSFKEINSSPESVSVSKATIVAGFQSFSSGATAGEDVFVRPATGWANTAAPTARLMTEKRGEYVNGGIVVNQTVAAFVSSPSTADNQEAAGATVAIYRRPSGGWSGSELPVAQLKLPPAAEALTELAFTGSAVYVPTAVGETYVYQEPAGGWSKTIMPAATLEAEGQVSASGNSVLVGHSLFVRPRHVWSGRPHPAAVLTPQRKATSLDPNPEPVLALTSTTALYAEVNVQSGEGCGNPTDGCPTTIYTATRPARGWKGRITAKPILTRASSGAFDITGSGGQLFWSEGNHISIYELGH